jgi:hypothetical protein
MADKKPKAAPSATKRSGKTGRRPPADVTPRDRREHEHPQRTCQCAGGERCEDRPARERERHGPEREAADDQAVDVVSVEVDATAVADELRDCEHHNRVSRPEYGHEHRWQDDCAAESGDAGDRGGHERGQPDQDDFGSHPISGR